jgi:hypothetical protein
LICNSGSSGELVAAEPGDEIRRPQVLAQRLGDGD